MMPSLKPVARRRQYSARSLNGAMIAIAIATSGAPIACSLATRGNDYTESSAGPGSQSGSVTGGASASAGGAGQGGGESSASGAGGGTSSDGAGGSVNGAGGSGGGPLACPSGMGPEMVLVPAKKPFCIDSTEVTVAQYLAWTATGPSIAKDPSYCKSWNFHHLPKETGAYCSFYISTMPSNLARPVACVNWCDAEAFCDAAGKRLCGGLGGGPNKFTADGPSTAGEWYFACSADGKQSFPYGNDYNEMSCNGIDYDKSKDALHDAGEITTCEGGYPGIFDMSGNVSEWENGCDAQSGASDLCFDRNASYKYGSGELSCDFVWQIDTRDFAAIDVGFRCCADPL